MRACRGRPPYGNEPSHAEDLHVTDPIRPDETERETVDPGAKDQPAEGGRQEVEESEMALGDESSEA
jgi:hypothetical protein